MKAGGQNAAKDSFIPHTYQGGVLTNLLCVCVCVCMCVCVCVCPSYFFFLLKFCKGLLDPFFSIVGHTEKVRMPNQHRQIF